MCKPMKSAGRIEAIDILRRILVLLLAVWGYAYSCTGATVQNKYK